MAILFTFLCGLSVLILGYFGYYFTQGHYVHSAETLIDSEINHIINNEASEPDQFMIAPERLYLKLDSEQNILAGNIERVPDNLERLVEGILVFDRDDRHYAAKIHTFKNEQQLLVAVDITKTAKDLKKMQILAGVSIIFVLVVVVVSFLISTFVVTRTSRIATTAKHIMNTGDLSKRIAIDSRWDDLSYMTSVLNEFLDRNQEMVQDIQTVSDNIAHDLRTPLTRLQADLEILAKDPNLKNSKELEQVMAESDRLLATFNALLRISRIETRRQKSAFERIDLNVIVNDVVGFYDPLVQDAGIAIKMQTAPCAMIGDRDLVFQLFANILDNAIKFTPQGGDIQIAMDQQDNHVVVTIHDSGQGVMEENLGKIFQRFFRTDKSRHTKGNGLGLALVKAVVTLHDGDVWAENDNGLKISIRLPYQPT